MSKIFWKENDMRIEKLRKISYDRYEKRKMDAAAAKKMQKAINVTLATLVIVVSFVITMFKRGTAKQGRLLYRLYFYNLVLAIFDKHGGPCYSSTAGAKSIDGALHKQHNICYPIITSQVPKP
jgi:hypothetical protein